MEQESSYIIGLVGKKIIVRASEGIGTRGDMTAGDYKGILQGFDGEFLKLEYEVKQFIEGKQQVHTEVLYLNKRFLITAEEFRSENE